MAAASAPDSSPWWLNQRPNYRYVVMAAGILCFLAYTAIWETIFASGGGLGEAGDMLLGIIGRMGMHLLLWVPYILLEMWAYKLLPAIDRRVNPAGGVELRRQVLIVGCVVACLLPLLPPAVLVIGWG